MADFVQMLFHSQLFIFILVFVCGFIGSSVNAFAGGGTFLAFPALLVAGLPPVIANATSKIAFIPGNITAAWAYRHHFAGAKSIILSMLLIALVGGSAGALLTLYIGNEKFKVFIPWLILGATILAWLSPTIKNLLQKDAKSLIGRSVTYVSHGLLVFTSIYGGFFGAGIGILLIATLGLRGITDLNLTNAIKNIMSVLINLAAVIMYIVWGSVNWKFSIIQMAGAIAGGYCGGIFGRTLNPNIMRKLIVTVGFVLSGIYFYKYGSIPFL